MSGNQYIYQRVWEIHETLHPKPDDLVSTARFFVREGELQIWDAKKKKKKKRYFFLFNDIILLCRKENQKRYWLRIHITLRSPHVTVEEIENSSYNNEFRLHCRSRSFMLYAPTADIRREWVEDLRRSIQGTHAEEKKDKDKPEEKEEKRKSVKKIAQPIKKDASAAAAKKVRDEDDSDESDDDEESPESEEDQKTKRTAAKDDTKTPRSASTKTKRKNPPPQQQQQEQHPQQVFDPFAFPNANANPYGGGLPAGVGVGGGYPGAAVGPAGFGSNPYGGMNPGLGVNAPNNNLQRIQTNTAPFAPSAQPNPFFPSNNQSIISAPASNPFATPSPYNNPGLNYNPMTPSPQGAFNPGVGGGLPAQGGFNAGAGGGIAPQGGFNAGVGVGISAQGGGYNVGGMGGGGMPGLGQNQFGTNPQMGNPFANPGAQPVNPFAPSGTPVNPFLNGSGSNFTPNPF